jgi:hypothetical protein
MTVVKNIKKGMSICIIKNGKNVTKRMNVLVGTAFVGCVDKNGSSFLYINSNKYDCRASNLRIASRTEIYSRVGRKNWKTETYKKWIKENGIFENGELVAKPCAKCGEILSVDNFLIRNGTHTAQCIICNQLNKGIKNPGRNKLNKKLLEQNNYHCSVCDTTKPLDEFHNNKSTPHGKEYLCKICMNAAKDKHRKKMGGISNKHKLILENRELAKSNQKRCTKCKSIKDLDEFNKNSTCVGGKSSICRICTNKS